MKVHIKGEGAGKNGKPLPHWRGVHLARRQTPLLLTGSDPTQREGWDSGTDQARRAWVPELLLVTATATESKSRRPGAASQARSLGVWWSPAPHTGFVRPKNVLQRGIRNVFPRDYGGRENGKWTFDFLVTATYHIPWGRPRSQCDMDNPQVRRVLEDPSWTPSCDFPPALQRTP